MPLSPYITFSGNCAAAIAFYRQTLGAELVHQITYGEMPQNAQDAQDGCPSGQHLSADCIAHASLRVAGSELMLGDSPGGGSVEMDWQETFWAHGFGKTIDRFGVPWMVNVVKQA
ncbi:VOC family protein [Raoultella planticola]|jgi:PhnB protein|nr:VOC family protein [Raoultella planticola]